MNKFIAIIFLSISLTTPSQANDLSDFEIEGMSIGDSLLDFMSKDEIKNNTMQYFTGKRKYFIEIFHLLVSGKYRKLQSPFSGTGPRG